MSNDVNDLNFPSVYSVSMGDIVIQKKIIFPLKIEKIDGKNDFF